MLKYIQTIRDLYERGSNWQGYEESFRALRGLHGWGWDTVESELWLQAGRTVGVPYSGAPFQSKGEARQPAQQSNNPCLNFNKGCIVTVEDVATSINANDVGQVTQQQNVPASDKPVQVCFLPLLSTTLDSKQLLLPSPVSPLFFNHVLQGYDNNNSQYLTQGFTHGFRIGCINLPNKPQLLATNLKSAFAFP